MSFYVTCAQKRLCVPLDISRYSAEIPEPGRARHPGKLFVFIVLLHQGRAARKPSPFGHIPDDKRNNLKAFPPLTPALTFSFHPSTSSIASKFSTTLRHFSVSPSGGKNGWSVPKSILEAPSCRLPRPTA